MKQRLLLALLMLLTSAGFLKAQVTITIPEKGNATVTETTIQVVVSPNYKPLLTVDNKSASFNVDSYTIKLDDASHQVVINNPFESLKITGLASSLTVDNGALESITASGVGLETLTLTAASGLKILDISNNKLSGAFDPTSLTSLETLNASKNSYTGIASSAWASTITSINFSNNKFKGDVSFSTYGNLETLEIADNELTSLTVPATIKKLNVGGNKLTTITGLPTSGVTVTWGKQTISASSISGKKANGDGFNMSDLEMTFGKPTAQDVDWKEITNIKWERKTGSGSTGYETVDHGHKRDANAAPSTFLFYDSNRTYVSGTYRATITYNNVTMVVEDIVISPAEFTLTLQQPDYISVYNTTKNEAATNNSKVSQGDVLKVTITKEGYSWSAVGWTSLVNEGNYESDGDTYTTYVRVAGTRAADNTKDIEPIIESQFDDKFVNVRYNTIDAKAGSVSVKAIKDNKETIVQPGETGTSVPKFSKLEIRITAEVGWTPTVKYGTKEVSMTPDAQNQNLYLGVIESVEENTILSITMAPTTTVDLTLKVEGDLTTIDAGQFTNSQVSVGSKTLTKGSLAAAGLVVGDEVQLVFSLTKQAVYGGGTSGTFVSAYKVTEVKLGSTSLTIPDPVKVANPVSNEAAALTYTIPFTVPATDADLTITFKKQPSVEIVPENGNEKQTYVYDGNSHSFAFTTNPKGFESDVVVKYLLSNEGGNFISTTPKEVGVYKVSVAMNATTEHAAIAEDQNTYSVEITKAKPSITTVPTVDVQNGKYVVTNGVAKLGNTVLKGVFYVSSDGNGGVGDDQFSVTNQPAQRNEAHLVTVSFKATNDDGSDNKNFEVATVSTTATIDGEGELDSYSVKCEVPNISGLTVEMYNGDQKLDALNGASVPSGTKLTLYVQVPQNVNISEVKVNSASGTRVGSERCLKFEVTVRENVVYKIEAQQDYTIGSRKFNVNLNTQKVSYTGNVVLYDPANVEIKEADGTTAVKYEDLANVVLSYSQNGQVVKMPKDAGKYDVTITIPVQSNHNIKYREYAEYTNTVKEALVITAVETEVVEVPQSTLIAKGHALSQSDFIGGKVVTKGITPEETVSGKFAWKNTSYVPKNGEICEVIFTPTSSNYASCTTTLKVAVSDNNLVTFAQPVGLGVISVKDANGTTYETGQIVQKGTKLTITATPNDGFELDYILVNGSRYTTSPVTYEVGDGSVAIEAHFSVIVKPGNFKVTVPEYVRGTIITGGGEHVVAEGGTLSFTVATASADASKVSVKASNGTVTKGSNGRYTLSGLTANSTVTVSLSNPTALKVDIQKSYLNAGKYHVATVEVESDYTDGKFYYGDEITVVAYPESGVKFEKWSDGSKDQVHDIVLTGDLKLTATFSGTPTGIEDIMAASIATGKGCVWVRGIANADVTIVSIAGRVQARQRISGDTRIDVPAGIYVVVLESGSDVKRVKVIVK